MYLHFISMFQPQGGAEGGSGSGILGLLPWILIIVVCCFLLIRPKAKRQKKRKAIEGHVSNIEKFSATQTVIGYDGNTGLSIDEQRRMVCLVDHRQQILTHLVVSYNDLLSSELFEDGVIVTRTVRSSQIGGAVIGGLALGGAGMIIGGLSGKTKTSGKVKRIDLRLIINDTQNPLHDVNFLNREIEKGGFFYKKVMQQARYWHGLIEVLIKRADIENKEKTTKKIHQIQSSSVADELKKLVDLRDSGVLSIDEFQQQKAKLLGL